MKNPEHSKSQSPAVSGPLKSPPSCLCVNLQNRTLIQFCADDFTKDNFHSICLIIFTQTAFISPRPATGTSRPAQSDILKTFCYALIRTTAIEYLFPAAVPDKNQDKLIYASINHSCAKLRCRDKRNAHSCKNPLTILA